MLQTKECIRTHKSVFEYTKVYSNTQKCIRIHKNVLVCLAPVVSSFRRKLVTYIAVCQVKSAITRKCVVTPKNGGALYSPLFAPNPVSSRRSLLRGVSCEGSLARGLSRGVSLLRGEVSLVVSSWGYGLWSIAILSTRALVQILRSYGPCYGRIFCTRSTHSTRARHIFVPLKITSNY